MSALLDAAERGDLLQVKVEVEKRGGDPQERDSDGWTPLHWAARNGHLPVVKYLVENKLCDVNAKTNEGYTPLSLACRGGHLPVVEYLLNCDVDVNTVNKRGYTPLHEACWFGHSSVVKYLVENKLCDINVKNGGGSTPLSLACHGGHLPVVEYLVNCDVDVNTVSKFGYTPLHYACGNGHLPVVKYLVENKLCDVNCKTNRGNTPLSLACSYGRSSVVKYLVENKLCDVNVKNDGGYTPLSLACQGGHYDMVRVLLDNGANPEALYVREDGSPTYPGQTVVKVFILGSPGGGKSTLSKALPSISSGTLSRLRNRLTKVSGIKQQTAGIDHQVVESEQFGLIHIYDFAGHEEFYASHDAMIDSAVTGSTGVFLILTDLQKCEKECEQSMAFWLSFVKNHATSMETPPHVLLLGSHADKVSKQEKARKENTIATLLRNSAFSSLDIKGYLEIDCRHAESDSMTHLREVLIGSFEVLRSRVSENFAYHCFLIFLVTRFIQSPAVQLSNVISVLGMEKRKLYQHLPTDLSEFDTICQSFNSHGRILYLRCAESIGKSWIIIDRQSLLARINGTIFAPKGFTEHCPALASSTGVVPQSVLAAHFPELDVALITQFLTFFEFCCQLSDPETLQHLLPPDEAASGEPFFFFPALVGENAPKGLWQASDQLSYHSGWILQCTQPENFFTPRLLQTLILRVCFALALPRSDPSVRERPSIHRQCKVWKNGVCWSMLSGADGLLEITSKHVIVLVRSLQRYEIAAVQLRSTLIRMVLDAQKEFCAGISPSESMFHPHDATQYPLSPASGLELFNSAVIAQAVVEAEPFVVSNRDSRLEVEKLLHFEPYTYLGKGYLCKFLGSGSIGTLLVNIEDRFSGVSQLDGTTDFLRTLKLLSRQDDVTREHLRNHFDKYSIFAGRNILAETGLASSALTKQPLLDKDEALLCTGSSDSSLQLGGDTTGSDVPLTVNIVASGGNAAGGGATGGIAIQGADGSSGGQTTGGSAVGGNAAVTVNVTINVAGGVQDKSSAHASLVD